MESPWRFQLVVATLAVGGAFVLAQQGDRDERTVPRPVLTFADAGIDESSGLVERGGLVLTVNDSGDAPVVYAVDAATGETVGRTTYTTDEVVDVEALAPEPGGALWVGDIGDNGEDRDHISVYRLPGVGRGDVTVSARRFDLVYPGGPRDAEALLVSPRTGRLYVVSKGLFGGRVYAAPRRLDPERPSRLSAVGRAGGLVTDGAFLPDGRHAVLRTYATLSLVDTSTWESVAGMTLPQQPQGEGVAARPGGREVLVSTEGAGSEVVAVPLTPTMLRILDRPAEEVATVTAPVEDASGLPGPAESRWGGLAVVVLLAALALRAARRRGRSTR